MDAVYELLGPVEGGMIALTLNREASVQDFNELSDDIRNENVAWMASLGIIRSFESGGLATTEISGLINRTVQTPSHVDASTKRATDDLVELELERAPTRLQPLLASSSIALGAMLFGLRRVRKTVQLQFTSNRSRA